MAGTFELKKSKTQFMWNLKASNGRVILTSERYSTKKAAQNGIESVRKNCKDDKCFDRKVAKNGKPYFSMIARNKQVIGSSQMYSSKASMENGIRSIQANAKDAKLSDLTE